ncbi:pilus assembly protein [Anaerocolumna chitinilytica]|nr:pilus assembly protein [Anaerocolumna chitinilytica]
MRRKLKGSYTLEAAILIPLILYIIIALIYTSFLLHDRGVIEGAVHLLVLNGERAAFKNMDTVTSEINYDHYIEEGIFHLLNDREDEAASMKNLLKNNLSKKVILADISDINVGIGKKEITVNVNYKFSMPIRGVWEFFHKGGTQFTYTEKKVFDKNEEFIRLFQIGMDIGTELPGADSILSMLQKSIGWLQ